MTDAERAEWEAERERVMTNVLRTRQLAEKAQAKLDAQKSGLIEVWLERDDVDWLASDWTSCADTSDDQKRYERIRSAANAALNTARLN